MVKSHREYETCTIDDIYQEKKLIEYTYFDPFLCGAKRACMIWFLYCEKCCIASALWSKEVLCQPPCRYHVNSAYP